MTEPFLVHFMWEAVAALGAGLLLNLTPCVLPAIPVKVRTILRQAGATPAQRSLAGLAFTAGSLAFFLVLGGVTAALHWTWGSLFQSRLFLIVLVCTLVGFAISTFMDIRIPSPRWIQTLPGRGFMEPLFSGAVSALLASSCTGPFLGGVVAYAVTRPPAVIIGLFAVVGVGLSLPYLIILIRPSLLEKLPRAGPWSRRVRQSLAFVLLAAAVFFAQSLVPVSVGESLWIGWAALLVLWAAYAALADRTWTATLTVMTAAIAGVGLVSAAGLTSLYASNGLDWMPFTSAALGRAAAADHPVLLEFTADWCINCRVLEKTVYSAPGVIKAVHAYRVVTLRADLTRPDRRLEHALSADGGAGLPYAVVLDGRGRILRRFSGLFTVGSLERALRQAGAS